MTGRAAKADGDPNWTRVDDLQLVAVWEDAINGCPETLVQPDDSGMMFVGSNEV